VRSGESGVTSSASVGAVLPPLACCLRRRAMAGRSSHLGVLTAAWLGQRLALLVSEPATHMSLVAPPQKKARAKERAKEHGWQQLKEVTAYQRPPEAPHIPECQQRLATGACAPKNDHVVIGPHNSAFDLQKFSDLGGLLLGSNGLWPSKQAK
jgi:hypothetical protein